MNLKVYFKKLCLLVNQAQEKRLYLASHQDKYKGKKIIFKSLNVQEIIMEYPECDLELNCSREYQKILDQCLTILELSDIPLDWNRVYYQLSGLRFRVSNMKYAEGEYSVRNNLITLSRSNEYNIETVFHELLHAITTVTIDNVIACGFEYENGIMAIGSGINEGYTATLTRRLTGEDSSYLILQNFAQKLEIILTPKVMQKLYFGSNLNELIKEMNKYVPLNDITTFLCDLDYIRNTEPEKNYEEIKNRIFRAEEFLISMLAKRSKVTPFTDEELDNLDSLLITKIKYKNYSFEFLNEDERKSLVEKELNRDLEYIEPIKGNIKMLFIAEKLPKR